MENSGLTNTNLAAATKSGHEVLINGWYVAVTPDSNGYAIIHKLGLSSFVEDLDL